MRLAVIGSRDLIVEELNEYLPTNATEIISGGARGIDTCARTYALKNGIKLTEFLPDYKRYGRYAPLKRNLEIIEYADELIAFWDGKSAGTAFTIQKAQASNKPVKIIYIHGTKR